METSEILYGTTRIAYGVRRSARRKKTVAVAVEPDGAVRVTAPVATPPAELDAIVHRKASWILERRRRQAGLEPAAGRREAVSGEGFLYLGRHYRLRVLPVDGEPGARASRSGLAGGGGGGRSGGARARGAGA